jgi:hypothetical protein
MLTDDPNTLNEDFEELGIENPFTSGEAKRYERMGDIARAKQERKDKLIKFLQTLSKSELLDKLNELMEKRKAGRDGD